MAFLYDAGLRIRPPEPMPDCLAGESAQDYFARVLGQSSIESATTAENASGDSAPTPFNLGALQSDVAQALLAIEGLGTDSGTQQVAIDALTNNYATGVVAISIGATSAVVTLPSDGNWRVERISPLEQKLANDFVSDVTINTFKANFDAAAANGSFNWCARKIT